MKNTISYTLWWVYYHLHTTISQLFTKKPTKYLLVIMGRYPENFKYVLDPLIVHTNEFRYSVGPNTLITTFHAHTNLAQTTSILSRGFDAYVDNFMVVKAKDAQSYQFKVNYNVYKNLYGPIETSLSTRQKLDDLQVFLHSVTKSKNEIAAYLRQVQKEIQDEKEFYNNQSLEQVVGPLQPTQEEIEQIVDNLYDKIRQTGYESLTEEEKSTLSKYTKND